MRLSKKICPKNNMFQNDVNNNILAGCCLPLPPSPPRSNADTVRMDQVFYCLSMRLSKKICPKNNVFQNDVNNNILAACCLPRPSSPPRSNVDNVRMDQVFFCHRAHASRINFGFGGGGGEALSQAAKIRELSS